MDVYLLSRLLRELIIDNERVPLPGIGYLITTPQGAKFSQDRLAILPPTRKITFKADKMASGDMIWKYYALESGVDEQTAKTELETFMTQLIPTLRSKKIIDFPGIGRLRCTMEGNVYFVAADTDNIFDNAFGFEQVTLRPIAKTEKTGYTTIQKDEDNLQPLASIIEIGRPASVAEPVSATSDTPIRTYNDEQKAEDHTQQVEACSESAQEEPQQTEQEDLSQKQEFIPDTFEDTSILDTLQTNEPVRQNEHIKHKTAILIISIIAALIIILAVFYLLAHNGILDSLLYTEEELQLLQNS